MAVTNNGSVTAGGTAQDVLAVGHNVLAVVINNESSDTNFKIRVDATADSSHGEIVYPQTSITINGLCGRQVSLYGATTGKAFSWREAL